MYALWASRVESCCLISVARAPKSSALSPLRFASPKAFATELRSLWSSCTSVKRARCFSSKAISTAAHPGLQSAPVVLVSPVMKFCAKLEEWNQETMRVISGPFAEVIIIDTAIATTVCIVEMCALTLLKVALSASGRIAR